MFNPADFDALTAALEERYAQRPATPDMKTERAMLLYAVSTARHLAESFDLMAPEPAPVRLCQECGAAPAIRLSRLCEACYAIAVDEIRAELAQEQPAACSNCGAAPELPYATLCQECYARFIGEIEERHKKAAIVAKEPIEEELQEYILIEPGQEPSGDEVLVSMLPYSAAMLNSCFGKSKLRWLPTAKILGGPAIVDASDDALEIVG